MFKYRILPRDLHADHWNPLDDVTDEIDLAEMCASLLPICDPREAPFIEVQRDWLKAAVFHIAQQEGSLPAAFNFLTAQVDPLRLLEVLQDGRRQPVADQRADS